MRQSVPGLREDGRWVIAVSHIAAAVVILVVVGLIAVAALTAPSAQEATRLGSAASDASPTQPARSQARAQAIGGFGLLGLWVIGGAVLGAKSNPGRKLVFGEPLRNDPNLEANPAAATDLRSAQTGPEEDRPE